MRQMFRRYSPAVPKHSEQGFRKPHPAEFEMQQTWKRFRSDVELDSSQSGRRYLYRGQAHWGWNLVPSLFRGREGYMGASMQRKALNVFLNDTLESFLHHFEIHHGYQSLLGQSNILTKCSIAQHYGVPTPLLDWTYSPMIAAFMAYWYAGNRSDTDPVRMFRLDCTAIPSQVRRVRLPPIRNNVRAYLQQGVFTCVIKDQPTTKFDTAYVDDKRLGDVGAYISIVDLEFSPSIRRQVLREMRSLNISAQHLFPDSLDFLAGDLREDLLERVEQEFG
jgi:FRG domain